MRMFDYMRRDSKYAKFIEETKGIPLIIADDIASWYQSLSNERWDQEDFPILAPLYNHVFFDFVMKNQDKSSDKIEFPDEFGVYCSWRDPKNMDDDEFIISSMKDKFHHWVNAYDAKWAITIACFWRIGGKVTGPIWKWIDLLDKNGKLVLDEYDNSFTFHVPVDMNVIDNISEESKRTNVKMEDVLDDTYQVMVPFLHVTALAINFFHCKNVKIIEHQEGKYIPHTNAQKRRGDKPLPSLTYKTLIVDNIRMVTDKTRNETGLKGSKSLHFVIGHFHTYTPEKPMFGNPKLTGSYFIPFHARGKKDNGVVVKDYQTRRK